MKFLVVAFALLSIIVLTESAGQSITKGCTVDGSFFKVGEQFQPYGKCELAECKGLNKLTTQTCAERATEERCFRKPADVTQPYPDCCPQWICN